MHVVREDALRQGLLFAGTERGAFVSFDDGDHWQALQLNLPVTSVRDFQVYDDDLIVATHGRGFWVIDDISALRQIDDSVAQADAYLFRPADQVLVDQGSDNGTGVQKDEPITPNPPDGVYIDYYLGEDAPGSVTLQVLDGDGGVLATFPAPDGEAGGRGSAPRAGGIPNVTALWRPEPAAFRTDAGMHRVTWLPYTERDRGFGDFSRAGPPRKVARLPGEFTVKLTVRGRTYTQKFTVKPDPTTSAAQASAM